MPFYEYQCPNDHRFEVKQSFDSPPQADCPTCNTGAQRVILPVAVHYKGSGFYTTDYARSKARASESSNGASGDGVSGSSGVKDTEKASSAPKASSSTPSDDS